MGSLLAEQELDISVWLWSEKANESKFLVLEGKANLTAYDSFSYTFSITANTNGLEGDLLTQAYDPKQYLFNYTLNGSYSIGATSITVNETVSLVASSGNILIGNDLYNYSSVTSNTFNLIDSLTSNYSSGEKVEPNVSFEQGRSYPMSFGVLKHTAPFILAVSCITGCSGEYYSDGKTLDMQDGGLSVDFNQTGNNAKIEAEPVYGVTMDINADDGTAGSATGNKKIIQSITTYIDTKANIPLAGAYKLFVGDIFYATDENNKQYRWDGNSWGSAISAPDNADNTDGQINLGVTIDTSGGGLYSGKANINDTVNAGFAIANDGTTGKIFASDANYTRGVRWDGTDLETRGVNVTTNGTNSTATRLTIIGGTAPSTGLSSATRLDFTVTEDGQTHFYTWNTSTNAGWLEQASIGQSTVGADNYISTIQSDIFGLYAETTSSTAFAIRAKNAVGTAIYATSDGSTSSAVAGASTGSLSSGVSGSSPNGYGVSGSGSFGVFGTGTGTSGIGVRGNSTDFFAGDFQSTNHVGARLFGAKGAMQIFPQSTPSTTGWGASEVGYTILDNSVLPNRLRIWIEISAGVYGWDN